MNAFLSALESAASVAELEEVVRAALGPSDLMSSRGRGKREDLKRAESKLREEEHECRRGIHCERARKEDLEPPSGPEVSKGKCTLRNRR
jgi:hypothetical protein